MTDFVWTVPCSVENIDSIDLGIQLYPHIKSILVKRGIDTAQKFLEYSKPHTENLHSPWLMIDMKKAVERIVRALNEHQKILVYGDYDVDGTTAIALVYSFLQKKTADVDFYVPDRYKEGYGVSEIGIQKAIADGVQVIITLDCGIKANHTINIARQAGIDVIVCDHHNQGDVLPPAYAILDPKRTDETYPFKELSGCGVGFKLLHAICEYEYEIFRPMCSLEDYLRTNLYCYLDYVAISTAADIVPIVGENRIYMYYGLKKMLQKPLLSVKMMLANAKLIVIYNQNEEDQIVAPSPLTVSDIVFKIAPKINAAGRMCSAHSAIKLLLAQTPEEACSYFTTVVENNNDRREKENIICKEADAMILSDNSFSQKSTTVLYKDTWHKGVVGIAAAKMIEKYYKPTIILCGDGDIISGSARSVEGFDLYSAIEACSDLLSAFGGHTHAAGLSMPKENFEPFCKKFDEVVSERITENQKSPSIQIDEEITLDNITNDFYSQIQYMAPFGPQNMEPVFAIRGIVPDSVYFMGGENNHIKLNFRNVNNTFISAVGFGMAEKWRTIPPKSKIDICFTIVTNVFRGNTSLQLQLKDIKRSEL